MIPDNKEDGYIYSIFFLPQVNPRPQSWDKGTNIYRSPSRSLTTSNWWNSELKPSDGKSNFKSTCCYLESIKWDTLRQEYMLLPWEYKLRHTAAIKFPIMWEKNPAFFFCFFSLNIRVVNIKSIGSLVPLLVSDANLYMWCESSFSSFCVTAPPCVCLTCKQGLKMRDWQGTIVEHVIRYVGYLLHTKKN